jgi:hypothetical protein
MYAAARDTGQQRVSTVGAGRIFAGEVIKDIAGLKPAKS